MMGLYEKNLEALNKRFPGMDKLIEEKKDELLQKENLDVESEINLEGREILKVQRNNRTLYLAGKRSASLAAANQIKFLGKIEYSAPLFMVGIGNGCYLEEIFKEVPKKNDNMVMVYEPSFSIFYEQLFHVDIEELFEDRIVALLVEGINEEGIKPLIKQMLRGDRVSCMRHFILPNYNEICPEKVLDFQKVLKDVAEEYLVNINTVQAFSKVAVENMLKNADYVRTGYQAKQLMEAIPREMPAIIVSAGPSLNKNIEELKKAKNKAFIIAVDTAMKPLLRNGIIPDMYAIIDGTKPLELVAVEESRNIPLLSEVRAAHAVMDYHKGKKFFFREFTPYFDRMYEMNHKEWAAMDVGGSVATAAFSLACYLGLGTVIMVGQDLALTGNKTHADGTFKEKMEELDTSKMKMVPGNVEEKVPTRPDFDHYRIWFEDFIARWKNMYPNFRVINATEGGAKIEGTEILTLKEAIEKECKIEADVSANIEKLEPMFNPEEQKKILVYMKDTPKKFHEMAVNAAAGKKLYQKLDKLTQNHNMDNAAYDKLLKQIKKNTKKIEKNQNYSLVEETLGRANSILKTSQYIEYGSFEEECKEIARRGILFMELVEECANLFEGFSDEVFGKIEE